MIIIWISIKSYGNTTASYLGPLQVAQNKTLRALQFITRYYPVKEMHKEYQILKVPDIIEYKLSKLIHSLLKDSPKLSEVLHKLIIPSESIHTRNTRNTHQVYSKREKNDNLSANHRKNGIINQILKNYRNSQSVQKGFQRGETRRFYL